MLKKLQTISSAFLIFLISVSISKADLLKPNSDIKPDRVIEIQLSGLQNNDLIYKDLSLIHISEPTRRS